ncbi:hypothetical protein BJ165DRAFT_1410139 [Panaeolus papilionaceus]|nr:hypothetical protein BJ165DRAFT_1410139 [Panaeolus papilionaceus]
MSSDHQTASLSSLAVSSLPSQAETPLVVMVQDTCFWLTVNELTKFSDTFKVMIFGGTDIGSTEEGTTTNPLVLLGIKREDFEPLVRWIRFGSNPPKNHEYKVEHLLGMLHLADQWDMGEAQAFCFQGLWDLVGDPFFMLKVVTSYRKWEMVRPLIEAAVKVPLLDWKFEHPAIYEPIMKLKIRLNEVVRRTVQLPNIMPQSQGCTNHHVCTLKWRNDWRVHIMEQVFHPDHPLPLNQCHSVMSANSPNPNACRRQALLALRLDDNFDIEDDLYHDTNNAIMREFY